MGDEIINEGLQSDEELFLMRNCLKDGMTQQQTENYLTAFKKEIKNNHNK